MNDEIAQVHQATAIDAIKELLDANFLAAEKSADDDGKFSITFRVTFDRSHPQTLLKVTSRINQSVKDEIELNVPDINQPELPMPN